MLVIFVNISVTFNVHKENMACQNMQIYCTLQSHSDPTAEFVQIVVQRLVLFGSSVSALRGHELYIIGSYIELHTGNIYMGTKIGITSVRKLHVYVAKYTVLHGMVAEVLETWLLIQCM